MSNALETVDLFRIYAGSEGTAAALQGLNLSVARGEIVVVFGPSGSGKTTLLRIVAGLEQPSAGRTRVLGFDLRRLGGRSLDRFRATEIGYVDQHYSRLLPPELAAREIVELPLALAGQSRRSRRARSVELLERVGLAERELARPHELSGGEQQRIALCAALASRPSLLLADEPTGELDETNAAVTYSLIEDLVRAEGATALIVSHDLGSTSIADRIVQIRDGRVSAETIRGGSEELVVGRSGWLRLPEDFVRSSGIDTRARPALVEHGVLLTSPAEEAQETGEPEDRPSPKSVDGRDGIAAELDGVTKRHGSGRNSRVVVQDLSATFRAGRLTAITGRSGSGKTTVLHLLAALDLPTAGHVEVFDTRVSELDRPRRAAFRRQRVGLVAQDAPLISFLSAHENVELGLEIRAEGARPSPEGVSRALGAVGLLELAGQRVSRLSMGERQRVAIARAVVVGPVLLLADEPTARLDRANAQAVSELLARLIGEFGTTVVCSTHDPALLEVADHVIAL